MPSLLKRKGIKIDYENGTLSLRFKVKRGAVTINKTLSGDESLKMEEFLKKSDTSRRSAKWSANPEET